MKNSLMITILSNVVNQAPRVNQETVDNVKAIIAHLEQEKVADDKYKEIIGEEPKIYTREELDGEPEPYIEQPKKNRGGRPKKKK